MKKINKRIVNEICKGLFMIILAWGVMSIIWMGILFFMFIKTLISI